MSSINLLNKDGSLNFKGFATSSRDILFNRNDIKASRLRIKEWDFYQISNSQYCLQMVIGHVSYVASISCTLFDMNSNQRVGFTRFIPLVFDKLKMPRNAEQNHTTLADGKDFHLSFDVNGNIRKLKATCEDKQCGTVEIDIQLTAMDKAEKVVIATPFNKKNEFYYNYKQNNFSCDGFAKFGDVAVEFSKDTNGLLDWGRGVWPFTHSWYWGSASGVAKDGRSFSLNVGWGFGNTQAGSENTFFIDGKAHKLDKVNTAFDESNYLKQIIWKDNNGRLDFTFSPKYDNFTTTKLLWVDNSCHQVFGFLNGHVVTDDGEKIEIENVFGFIEYAKNKW